MRAVYIVTLLATVTANRAAFLDTLEVEDIVHQQVKRVVYLSSPIIREEYSIVATRDGSAKAPIHNYQVIIPPNLVDHFSYLSAIKDGSTNEKLHISEKLDCPIGYRCFVVNLPEPLTKEKPQVTLGLGISYVNRVMAAPAVAPQKTPLEVKLEMSPYFFTPYLTLRQKTEILVVKEFQIKSISCPEPNTLKPVPSPADSSLPGFQYTCGMYENVPPLDELSDAIMIKYKISRVPFFKINKLDRTVEFDPLRAQILVTEDYEFVHLGHATKEGSFSRLEFLQSLSTRGLEIQDIPIIPISLPATARNFQVRDEVGLIHSPMNRRQSPFNPDTTHVMEVQPRFPVSGGWNLAWTVSYAMPTTGFVDKIHIKEKQSSAKRLIIPMLEMFNDIAIEDFTLRIVLPADSTIYGEQAIVTSAADTFIVNRRHYTIPMALHAGQKQVHTITMKNVAKDHLSFAVVIFSYPPWTILRLPVITSAVALIIVLMILQLGDTNLGLEKDTRSTKEKLELARLFRQRRSILKDFAEVPIKGSLEDLKEASAEILRLLDSKGLSSSSSKKLYDEQCLKLNVFLQGHNPTDRFEKELDDLDEKILHQEAELLGSI